MMGSKFCGNCGSALTAGSAFCDNCGTPVPGTQQAAPLQSNSPPPAFQPPPVQPQAYQPPPQQNYSPPVQPPVYQQPPYLAPSGPPFQQPQAVAANISPKSRMMLALLNFFLGWLGAHKFYAGKAGQGVLIIIWAIVGYSISIGGGIAGALFDESGMLSGIGSAFGALLLWPLGLWIFIDFIRALMGKVKDSQGRLISN